MTPIPIPPHGKPEHLCRTPGCNPGDMRFDWLAVAFALALIVVGAVLVAWGVTR